MPTFLAPDQVTLHYDTRGAGRTRVLLAGAARHPEYLGDLAGLSGHHVIPHQRGVGHSPGPGLPYWDLAADVEALRTHLGLSHLTIVAHSAGSRLAMAYAARYPDQISAMLLITLDGEPPADLAERLAAVRAPVRIVGGAQDGTTGVADLADLFPAGEAVVLEECGHYPWVEQPELFREVAEEFLYRV